MSRIPLFLFAAVLACPQARAQAESPEKEACRQEERAQGSGEASAKLKCAVKAVFQSRIRRKAAEEPVEMTVGSPPMQTEDTDTPGDGNWEINLGVESEWGHGDRRIEGPVADINYGVGDRLQLTYEVPYVTLREHGEDEEGSLRAQGVGDSTFGLKYRFYDNEARGVSLALYPQVHFHTPGGDREVSEGGTRVALPLVLVSEFEHFSTSADLGVEVGDGEHRWFGGAGVGWRLNDRAAMMAELSGEDLNSSECRWTAGLGLRLKLEEGRALSASIGRDVAVRGDEKAMNHFMLSWQMEFGD
jgi:hypothetical protein